MLLSAFRANVILCVSSQLLFCSYHEEKHSSAFRREQPLHEWSGHDGLLRDRPLASGK